MKLTKKQKKHLYKIIGAGVCFAGGIAAKAFTGLDFGAFEPLMLIPAALFADFVGFLMASWTVKWFF